MRTVYFDVDDTIVIWRTIGSEPQEGDVLIEDIVAKPNTKIIEKIKEHKAKGDKVVIWSQGGEEWVNTVVKVLELEEYVDVKLSKPDLYYDDLHCTMWLTSKWVKVDDK